MRSKPYGEEEPKRSQLYQFIENLICGFMAFTGCIGGWLVHFGMDAWWMLGLSAVIAAAFALMMCKNKHTGGARDAATTPVCRRRWQHFSKTGQLVGENSSQPSGLRRGRRRSHHCA